MSRAQYQNPQQRQKTFATLPFNISAVSATARFLRGESPLIAIIGPSGWGKSHLLSWAANQASQTFFDQVEVTTAMDWDGLRELPTTKNVLILDDLQDVLASPRYRQSLRRALELRRKLHRPTVISLIADNPSVLNCILSTRSWDIGLIREPQIDERCKITAQIAKNQSIVLSRGTISLIANHVHGNGRSIEGALRRLKLRKLNWSQDRDTVQAAGILMPYLLGHNGWDPRDLIHDIVSTTAKDATTLNVESDQIAAYLMMELAEIGEDDVASFYNVKPAEVYSIVSKVKQAKHQPELDQVISDYGSAVVNAFNGY